MSCSYPCIQASVGLLLACFFLVFFTVPRTARNARRIRKRYGAGEKKRRRKENKLDFDMGMVLTEVATRLRSGATVNDAWERTLIHNKMTEKVFSASGACPYAFTRYRRSGSPKDSCADSTVHEVLDNYGVPLGVRRIQHMNRFQRWRAGISPVQADALAPTIAVCRMGHATGAPMAEILDSCAAGVTEASEARSARDVAIAGPQSSAHMLAVLPIVGIALGYVMGADPFGFLLGTLWGNIALILGIFFEISGIIVVKRLVLKAKEEADEQ